MEKYSQTYFKKYINATIQKGDLSMQIFNSRGWIFYIQEKSKFDGNKIGKWMYFFRDEEYDRVSELCRKAVEEEIVLEAKHSDSDGNNKGSYEYNLACFYLECDDMERHKKVIRFFLDNDMIRKTETGKLHNISFKLDKQTHAGEYGKDYNGHIKLEQFLDLQTGEWLK